MRLDQFSIQKYRSILKAEKLRLGDLTVLVGPNNEGKSNILQAPVTGMQELSGERPGIRPTPSAMRRQGRRASGYDWERDFPQSLQEDQPSGRTTMKFDFSLTDDEGKWSARMRFPVQASGKTWDARRLPQYKATVAEAVAAKPSAALKPEAKSLVRQLVAELEHKVSARQQ